MNYQTHIILAKGIKLDREYQNILNYTEDEMLNLVNTNKINEVTNYDALSHSSRPYQRQGKPL